MNSAKITAPTLWQSLTGGAPHPHLRLYHSYGDRDRVLVMGHALMHPPRREEKYEDGFFANAAAIARLFHVNPIPHAKVRITLGTEVHEIQAADDGFFAAEWEPKDLHPKTWEDARAELLEYPGVTAEGKVYMPYDAPFGIISDIDDTFLITNTDNILHRLQTILSNNAHTRQPFRGVVAHYNALALGGGATPEQPNPFFYVSSSEWNLYDYLKEFCRYHGMPEGVFLLNTLKRLHTFWNTGGSGHDGKFTRVARILSEFPAQRYILLGDDSQRDPHIYSRIVADFPGRIIAVYIRHRVKDHLARTRAYEAEMQRAGVEVCYFTHSDAAMRHSVKMGYVAAPGG